MPDELCRADPTVELFREDARLAECERGARRRRARRACSTARCSIRTAAARPATRGELLLADGRAHRDRRHAQGRRRRARSLHVPAPGQEALLAALQPGSAVTARIDWARRHRHMRFHTATHLLCALVPHPVDGCSITADYARLDFHMTEPLDKEALNARPGAAGRRGACGAPPLDQRRRARRQPGLVRSMSVQPPRGTGRVRLLEIDGVDLQPCGGTHVAQHRRRSAPWSSRRSRRRARPRAQGGARLRRRIAKRARSDDGRRSSARGAGDRDHQKTSASTRRVVLGFAEDRRSAMTRRVVLGVD